MYLVTFHHSIKDMRRKRSQMTSTMLPEEPEEEMKVKCGKIDGVEVFGLFWVFFLNYLFLCLFDDATWSKYGEDVGEVV